MSGYYHRQNINHRELPELYGVFGGTQSPFFARIPYNCDDMMNESLFDNRSETTPLADRMRPETLDDYCGQSHLIGEGKVLRRMIDRDEVQSMIFWGPPGVGKTTLAHIIAKATEARFINFSAVTSGIKEIREVMNKAEENRLLGTKTILFVDEIHRFNKAQQDAFLP